MKTLADKGELDLVSWFRKIYGTRADVICGIGDDCAVVRPASDPGRDWVLTSDAVIEGVHFEKSAPPRAVGHKAIARALSDIAAMGAAPAWALVNLVAPANAPLTAVEAICRQASATAARFRLAVVGGDTSVGRRLELHVFAVGLVPRGTAVLRSGACVSDRIYVTGRLGGSIAGRHLAFAPRIAEGAWLREGRWATAMIDISDGLALDLRRMTRMSGTGAMVEVDRLPLSRAARSACDGRSAVEHAIGDGEDYELLFTVPAGREKAFGAAWRAKFSLPVTRIGAMTGHAGRIAWVDEEGRPVPVRAGGYEHFRKHAKD